MMQSRPCTSDVRTMAGMMKNGQPGFREQYDLIVLLLYYGFGFAFRSFTPACGDSGGYRPHISQPAEYSCELFLTLISAVTLISIFLTNCAKLHVCPMLSAVCAVKPSRS